MNRQNTIGYGMTLGVLVPAAVFLALHGLFAALDAAGLTAEMPLSENFRARTIALVALASNAILLQRFQKRRMWQAMRGVVFPTFVFIVAWMWVYGRKLL
ncbi:MAG: hypothetical protein D6818_00825 [Bacteroidetes bacterium]|nr:MAG: hypothetical protein D6818_00825 [Bacteroidota bacterium]